MDLIYGIRGTVPAELLLLLMITVRDLRSLSFRLRHTFLNAVSCNCAYNFS